MHKCNKQPSYGELIDMLHKSESEAAALNNPGCVNLLLLDKFKSCYQDITAGRPLRPERFYDTVCRIAAPTKPSLRGKPKLTGTPLATYKRRVWVPKVRHTEGKYSTGRKYIHIYKLYTNIIV